MTADPEAFPAKVGETVRPAPRTYIGYRTPPVQEAVVLADGKTVITYLYDLDIQRARYEVHHYKEQPDGSFQEVLEDAGFFTGMAGEMTDAGPNNYSGYDIPDKINKVIQADGTTRIDYQYRLKTVTVTFIDRVKYTTTNLGSSEEGYRIGTMVSGAMKGTDRTPGAYYDNYVYDSATTATVTADGATVYRYFVPYAVGYKVEHKQQQPDGKYVLAERETFTGKAGTTVTPETKDYSPAYVSPPEQTVTIAEDGSTVVTYLYDTARYNVTFIDKVKDSEDELGRSVSERAYGSTVSGSEKGTDAGPGKYYEGYTYHSSTSATVRENGTTVYRYFVRAFAKYRVNHIWEQEDGERTTVETKQFRAGAGSEVTPAVNSYDGYDSPQPQTVRRGEGGEENRCLFSVQPLA